MKSWIGFLSLLSAFFCWLHSQAGSPLQLRADILLSSPSRNKHLSPCPWPGLQPSPLGCCLEPITRRKWRGMGDAGEEVSPTQTTYTENGELVGPYGKMKGGRQDAGQAKTTDVPCISQHTKQSHTSLSWLLFVLCLKCSSTLTLLTNPCVAFETQIIYCLLFASCFVHRITPSTEPFLYLVPIPVIIPNWIFN